MKDAIVFSVAGAALIVSVVVFLGQGAPKIEVLGGAGPTHSFQQDFLAGISVGERGTALLDSQCATLAWKLDTLTYGSTGTSTQAVALQGATIGDICTASMNTTTLTAAWQTSCNISASAASEAAYGTSTVTVNVLEGAVNFGTSTIRTCYFGY
jgi:hypothetical protein